MAGDDEESDENQIGQDAVPGPGDNALLMTMLAGVARTVGGKKNGGQHTDHAQGGGQAHVANQDAVEHGADDRRGGSLLGDLIGRGGSDIALKGLVMLQHIQHIPHLQAFVLDALKIFGFIILRYADARQYHTDKGNANAHPGDHVQKFLVKAAAHSGHQFGVHDDVQHHGGQIVQHRLPHTHSGTLLGVVGDQRRQGLGGHVDDGIANDVHHVEQQEYRHAVSFAGEEVEHAQQADGLDSPAQQHQGTDFSPAGIHPVVQKGQQRVGHSVENAGERQQAAYHQGSYAITDAGGITGQADQEIDCHTVEGVESNENDLPQFRLAVIHFIGLSWDRVRGCHGIRFLSFRFTGPWRHFPCLLAVLYRNKDKSVKSKNANECQKFRFFCNERIVFFLASRYNEKKAGSG